MNYDEYYLKCRKVYGNITSPIEDFYNNPVNLFPNNLFSENSLEALSIISKKVKSQFNNGLYEKEIMCEHGNIWEFAKELNQICSDLIPYLEKNIYNSFLYVDKVYIYRTKIVNNRESSYIWHYDNNPSEVTKNIIYLNNVNELNSPFEYFVDSLNRGVLGKCTRKGTKFWENAINDSRVDKFVKENLKKGTHFSRKVTGKFASGCSFNNNAMHRANPVIKGYRDAINIRVKPTLKKTPIYISPNWTTSFESHGSVPRDPEISWYNQNNIQRRLFKLIYKFRDKIRTISKTILIKK